MLISGTSQRSRAGIFRAPPRAPARRLRVSFRKTLARAINAKPRWRPLLVRDEGAALESLRASCFWVYAGTGPPRLLPPCGPLVGEDQGGGSRRPTRQASGGAFDNLPGRGDPPPRPAPARGGGCANAVDSTEMQQALALL